MAAAKSFSPAARKAAQSKRTALTPLATAIKGNFLTDNKGRPLQPGLKQGHLDQIAGHLATIDALTNNGSSDFLSQWGRGHKNAGDLQEAQTTHKNLTKNMAVQFPEAAPHIDAINRVMATGIPGSTYAPAGTEFLG